MNAKEHGSGHGQITEQHNLACLKVYSELGYGFLEAAYEGAMAHVLGSFGLAVDRRRRLRVLFRGEVVLVELNAGRAIDAAHEAQVLSDSKATNLNVGLLLSFGSKPEFQRFAFDNHRKALRVPRTRSHPGVSVLIRVHPRPSVS